MRTEPEKRSERPMRKEYDFRGAVVGKYVKQYADGAKTVRAAAKVKTPK